MDKIELMKPFQPLKPSDYASKFFDIEQLIKLWAGDRLKDGLIVQEKIDGLRTILEKKGKDVLIYFEDAKKDRSDYLPSLKKALLDLPVKEVILDGELIEFDKEGNQIERKDLIKWATSKDRLDDSRVVVNVFDILWKDRPLTDIPYIERMKIYQELLKRNKKLVPVEGILVKNEKELREAMEKVARIPGSEGAMIKVANMKDWQNDTINMAKLKNFKELTCI